MKKNNRRSSPDKGAEVAGGDDSWQLAPVVKKRNDCATDIVYEKLLFVAAEGAP